MFTYQIKVTFKNKSKDNKKKLDTFINLVGLYKADLNKRVMITIKPDESLKHLSSYIGLTMQKYPMFQSLLSLRATDFNVIKNSEKPKKDDSFDQSIKINYEANLKNNIQK